jgi:hypothetical protein
VTISDEKNEKGRGMTIRAKELASVMAQYKGRKAACDKILELSQLPAFGKMMSPSLI